jgi:hypothetical protein
MPLIKPEIQDVLRSAGLLGPQKPRSSETSLNEKLDAAGLSLEDTLEQLAFVAKESGNEALRVRCLETVLKAHGALKESAPAVPSFTIIINSNSTSDSKETQLAGVPEGVNPILLPRQLLKTLAGAEGARLDSNSLEDSVSNKIQ